MVRGKGNKQGNSPTVTSSPEVRYVPFDFASEFRKFLTDEANKALLQEVMHGPLLDEIRELNNKLTERDRRIKVLEEKVSTLQDKNDDLEQYRKTGSIGTGFSAKTLCRYCF